MAVADALNRQELACRGTFACPLNLRVLRMAALMHQSEQFLSFAGSPKDNQNEVSMS